MGLTPGEEDSIPSWLKLLVWKAEIIRGCNFDVDEPQVLAKPREGNI